MTNTEPKVSAEGRYTSSETSALLGIHRNSLRNYTDKGLIKCGYRRTTLRRFYLGREITRFWRSQW